ncbi:MAG: sigma-54-dependent Fis family transcriptional regulator [Planctomycetales bacterium]|nr:sigma-54-dependent Fis family transcriptional regulator [Planctomycetales bacterium]
MPTAIVIDDDRAVARLVAKALEDADVEVVSAETGEDGLDLLRQTNPDVVLLDIMLPEANGLELAQKIHHLDAKLPVIFITSSEDSSVAIEAMKLGAYDYVIKPLGIEQIQDLVERALATRRLMQSPVILEESSASSPDGDLLVGRSPELLEVYKQIGRVAAQDVAVLIRGESGTGKELIARAIYHHSKRSEQCFLAVNCAALSDTLLESELFGHEKGAFTGANQQHIGKFEQCNGGTIFLDEVGDMSPKTQAKVLRLLQEQRFERVGGTQTIEVDVRVVSATNRDLEQMVKDGEYRLDLLHRLNAFEIHLPALRDRGQDLQLLIKHFLARFKRELNKEVHGVSDQAMELLLQYDWPGNIRELQGSLRKSILMTTGPVLVPECLPDAIREHNANAIAPRAAVGGASADGGSEWERFIQEREASKSTDLYAEALEWMERRLLTHVLQKHSGNQSKAATELGITRGSLRHKIKSLGISIENVVRDSEEVDD